MSTASTYSYHPSLVGYVVNWHMNLSIAGVSGLTALQHCAYTKGDLDNARILQKAMRLNPEQVNTVALL